MTSSRTAPWPAGGWKRAPDNLADGRRSSLRTAWTRIVATRIQFHGDKPTFTHVPMTVHTLTLETKVTRDQLEDTPLRLT